MTDAGLLAQSFTELLRRRYCASSTGTPEKDLSDMAEVRAYRDDMNALRAVGARHAWRH